MASSLDTITDTPPAATPDRSHPLPIVDLNERRWINAAQHGSNPDAFRRLVELHEDRVFQCCLRWLGNREDASEASQDVFVRAHRHLHKFDTSGTGKFSTWLYQIALNRCRDTWKTAAFKRSLLTGSISDSPVPEPVCTTAQPDHAAQLHDDLALVERGLHAIPSRHRNILMLALVEGLPHADCATVLRCSPRAVEGRLYRARKALHDWCSLQGS